MKFILAKTHPACDPSWLLVIERFEQIAETHSWMSSQLYLRYGKDPHITKPDGTPANDMGALLNPVILGAKWLSTAVFIFTREGKLLVNQKGGMCPSEKIEALQTVESESWPKSKAIPDEIVYYTQWPGNPHYYVRSSAGRLFPFVKFNTFAELETAVAIHAPGAKLKEDDRALLNPNIGD